MDDLANIYIQLNDQLNKQINKVVSKKNKNSATTIEDIKIEVKKVLDKFEVKKRYKTKTYINDRKEVTIEFMPLPQHIKISLEVTK